MDPPRGKAMRELNEKTMQYLESRIPELAEGAVKKAYCKTLASGNKVLEAVNGQLVECRPDGSTRVIKPLPKPIAVSPEQRKVKVRRCR